MPSPPCGSIVWASEALAVLVVVGPVPVLVPVEVAELEVGAAVAGREESFASVYNHEFMVSDFCLHWSLEEAFRESRVSQRGSNSKT